MALGKKDNFKEVLFEYISPNTGLRLQHKITILNNIYEQDLLQWVMRFKEISRICNWNEAAKIEVLSQIVNYEIQMKIPTEQSSEDILNSILKLKYNITKSQHYYQLLSNIRQKIF
ncbi:hypothetical protein DMUE_4680 [Dictyocoela muelleri]|nr:hypothetical protein DMUE_4680 [Dictyocoela muelleri]